MLGLGTLLPWNFFMTATQVRLGGRGGALGSREHFLWAHTARERRFQHPSVQLLQYFTNRLDMAQNMSLGTAELSEDIQPSAAPTVPSLEHRPLSAIFNNVMTLCAMLPLLLFTCLNSFLHQRWVPTPPPDSLLHPWFQASPTILGFPYHPGRIPQSVRILGSLVAILMVFLVTAILVKVHMDALPFFVLTMIKIMLINCKPGLG